MTTTSALDLLPRPVRPASPPVAAGTGPAGGVPARAHMDGRFVYPGDAERLRAQAVAWAKAKGARGRRAVPAHFRALAEAGVDHLAIDLRQSQRAPAEVLDEIASAIMPALAPTLAAEAA